MPLRSPGRSRRPSGGPSTSESLRRFADGMSEPTGRLAALLSSGAFVVTSEIVPPRGTSGQNVTDHARGLVGCVDAVNVTDNPSASAHMSPLAGVAFVSAAGIEPTLQITVRDRNRLAITSDLLGPGALRARSLL